MSGSTVSVSVPGASPRRYSIFVGRGQLTRLSRVLDLARYSRVCVVTDETVARHWLSKIQPGLPAGSPAIVIPPGESQKTPAVLDRVWSELARCGVDRHSLIVNVGGGVIGDLGGFAAATFMRGVSFVQCPTTLLSQVDASIGGKVGADAAGVKNLVGAFAQPEAVVIDLDTLGTLPEREFRAGFAEVIKHGLIADREYFEEAQRLGTPDASSSALEALVRRSCEIKADIVMKDEKETGPRKLLNFGHTIGHALEAIMLDGPDALLHGEAVSIGMAAEAKLSSILKLLPEGEVARIEETLASLGLPVRLKHPVDRGRVRDLMKKDKKNKAGETRWTLLRSIGSGVFDRPAPEDAVDAALSHVLSV